MSFEVNEGQTDKRVKFLSRGAGYSILLTTTEVVLALNKHPLNVEKESITEQIPTPQAKNQKQNAAEINKEALFRDFLRMKLVGANAAAPMEASQERLGKSNYFIGNDPRKWRTNIANYAKVKQDNVYPGVAVVYYGNQRQLEHDLIVASGANPTVIKLAFRGARSLSIAESGNLILKIDSGEVILKKPIIYQEIGHARKQIEGGYVLHANRIVSFQIAEYDTTKPLVIDPVLAYSTYLGGSLDDIVYAIAADSQGNAYVTGRTYSTNFPTANAYRLTNSGGRDIFVAKLNPAGTALLYSTANPNANTDTNADSDTNTVNNSI